jgi:hypothetical protein
MNLQEMHESHVRGNRPEEWDWKYASASMKWYGWGSPVGLSIFFVALCVCGLIVRFAWLLH